jgi:hypothetical protein
MADEPRRSPVTEPTSPGAEEQDIGDLENETIFVPAEEHAAPEEHAQMRMGRVDGEGGSENNDLRDPYFRTDEGRAWLDEHEQRAAEGGAGR